MAGGATELAHNDIAGLGPFVSVQLTQTFAKEVGFQSWHHTCHLAGFDIQLKDAHVIATLLRL